MIASRLWYMRVCSTNPLNNDNQLRPKAGKLVVIHCIKHAAKRMCSMQIQTKGLRLS